MTILPSGKWPDLCLWCDIHLPPLPISEPFTVSAHWWAGIELAFTPVYLNVIYCLPALNTLPTIHGHYLQQCSAEGHCQYTFPSEWQRETERQREGVKISRSSTPVKWENLITQTITTLFTPASVCYDSEHKAPSVMQPSRRNSLWRIQQDNAVRFRTQFWYLIKC